MIFQSAFPVSPARIEPSAEFDFTASALPGFVTVSRALATATVISSAGLITTANADTARIDHDPLTKARLGLLVEEARSNLVLQSSAFDAAAWTKIRVQPFGSGSVVDATISPDGTQNADKLVEDATASNSHQIIQTISSTTNTDAYTFTIFAKRDTRSHIDIAVFEGTSFTRNGSCLFDLTAGTAGSVSVAGGATAVSSIKDYGNGWYRCSISVTLGGTNTNIQLRVRLAIASGFTYSGNGTSGLFIWGAQLERGAFPTSYVATTTTSVARNADVATASNFSAWWKAGYGAAVVRVRPSIVSGIRPALQFDDGTANNIIALRGNVANPELYVRSGGSDQAQIDAGTIAANTSYRLAGAWAANSCAANLNSGASVLDGVATIPGATQARFGSDGTNYLNGWIEAVEYYDQRMPSSTLQVLSSRAGYGSIIGPVFRDAIIS
jgi:hypothetical protein